MADFLESLGQGLRGAGAILSSPVYEQQNREQNMMLAEMQRRRAELGRALVVGIESGAVDPNNEQVKMTLQRLGIPGTAFGPSPQAQVQQQELRRSQAFTQWLQQQRAGGLGQGGMGGGLTPSTLRDVPPEVAMSPEYQQLVKRFTELKNLEKPTEHFDATSGNLIRSYPDGKTEVIQAEPGRKAPTMRTRISGDQEIQEEYDPATKTWKELGKGPRFARQVAPVIHVGDKAQKPPVGYRFTADGNLQKIPGGPADERSVLAQDRADAKLEKETAPVADLVNEIDRAIRMIDENPGVSGARGMLTRGKEFIQSTVTPGTPTPGSDFQSQIIDIQSRWKKLPTIAANRFKADASKIDSEIKGLGTFTSDTMARNSLIRLRDSLSSGLQRRGMVEVPEGGEDATRGKIKQPPKIASDADYEALPSGTEFIDPEGKRRRKP